LILSFIGGIRDKKTIKEYEENLKGTKKAIKRILELFEKYDIHATWATVGLLFAKNTKELEMLYPKQLPNYDNANLSPYTYIKKIIFFLLIVILLQNLSTQLMDIKIKK
jgi:hypothetical protein